MRFTLVKDLRSDALMRPLLNGLLLFTGSFLVADAFLKRDHIGLDRERLSNTLYGNEAEFIDPVSEHFVLELLHSDIFFMMMTLLTLSAIYARLCPLKRIAAVVINLAMVAALADVVLFVLAYYRGDAYLLPWLGAFWTWHGAALFMAFASLLYLNVLKKP
ncbi:MAG: hypothetical protein IE886_01035 [Campylobacterales bacterium]|nr:hypothetical protein [Campylobacterales bacterium]